MMLGKVVLEGELGEKMKFEDPNLRNLVAEVSCKVRTTAWLITWQDICSISQEISLHFSTGYLLARSVSPYISICLLDTSVYLLDTSVYLLDTSVYLLDTSVYLLNTSVYFLGTSIYVLDTSVYFLGTSVYLLDSCVFLGTSVCFT